MKISNSSAILIVSSLLCICGGKAHCDDGTNTADQSTGEIRARAEAKLLATEGNWGGVSGQILFKGELPETTLDDRMIKDPEICGKPVDESLIIDDHTNGLRNCFIYIRRAPKPIHPLLAKQPETPVAVRTKGCRLFPHCSIIRTGQLLRITSDDAVAHNVHAIPFKNASSGALLPAKSYFERPFPVPESMPIRVACDIHPQMNAHWLILDHPYAALTDESGCFRIVGLPAGPHELRIWHERFNYIDRTYKVDVPNGSIAKQEPIAVTRDQIYKPLPRNQK